MVMGAEYEVAGAMAQRSNGERAIGELVVRIVQSGFERKDLLGLKERIAGQGVALVTIAEHRLLGRLAAEGGISVTEANRAD